MWVKAKPTACSLLSPWTESMWEFNGSHACISHSVLERNVWSSICAICNYLFTCGLVADFVFLSYSGRVGLADFIPLSFYSCHLCRVNSGWLEQFSPLRWLGKSVDLKCPSCFFFFHTLKENVDRSIFFKAHPPDKTYISSISSHKAIVRLRKFRNIIYGLLLWYFKLDSPWLYIVLK